MVRDRIFVALDTPQREVAIGLAEQLAGRVGGVKLGLQFFSAQGPDGVAAVAATGQPVFLDLKLHDIPNTVIGAVRALMRVRPAFLTLHASGGAEMLRAAADEAAVTAKELGVARPRLLGVTVLTSLGEGDLDQVGQRGSTQRQVERLADLARANYLDGVVCSPVECAAVRRRLGGDAVLMVPGVRPKRRPSDDQRRVLTPRETLAAGASYMVIGRPITEANDPPAAVEAILEGMPA